MGESQPPLCKPQPRNHSSAFTSPPQSIFLVFTVSLEFTLFTSRILLLLDRRNTSTPQDHHDALTESEANQDFGDIVKPEDVYQKHFSTEETESRRMKWLS